jgi:hypothetical protein
MKEWEERLKMIEEYRKKQNRDLRQENPDTRPAGL